MITLKHRIQRRTLRAVIDYLGREQDCKTAARKLNTLLVQWENRAGLNRAKSSLRGSGVAAACSGVVVVFAVTFALLHFGALAADREAEWRQERLCEYHAPAVNQWAEKRGKTPPC